ncbi:MAG: 2,3-bisphosphoglycerate-independent phosphoglycerate mutase [Patescibacteria group bacterium]|nr:2,3-bisphosphoglycerate-independent phosphoglycerate mutase [Patescibacteria group bacterium]
MAKRNTDPLVLAILDGWGVGPKKKEINAIHAANTPFFDYCLNNYPNTQLGATGTDVGLEKNQMSGSESGHLNIGAGRIVLQDVRTILEAIDNGNFFKNPVFLGTINKVKKKNANIHLVGLMGNKDSPHAHPDIVLALLILFEKHNLKGRVFLHLFTDGRDSFPKSALELWSRWKRMIKKTNVGKVASVSGRFFGMDRLKNWDRLKKAYDAIVEGRGEKYSSFEKLIEENYKKGRTDEYIEPAVLVKNGKPVGKIKNDDGVIFFNFRSDRARQFSKLFVGTNTEKEKSFPKHKILKDISFVAMTNFGPDLKLRTAYPSSPLISTLPTALEDLRQLYIAEMEKFAHVTYFINGGYSDSIAGEERHMIDSPKTKSYADKPEMSASEIADNIVGSIEKDLFDVIVVNFANADMVGHTGNFRATIKGIECVDEQLKKIFAKIKKKNGTMVITADHGNADIMVDEESGRPFTFHTKNPVPFIVASDEQRMKLIKLHNGGVLANIAPTITDIMDIEKPKEMTEKSLI